MSRTQQTNLECWSSCILQRNLKTKLQTEQEKGQAGRQTFVEGHRQNFNHVKILTHACITSAITSGFNTSQISSGTLIENKLFKNEAKGFKLCFHRLISYSLYWNGTFAPLSPLSKKKEGPNRTVSAGKSCSLQKDFSIIKSSLLSA